MLPHFGYVLKQNSVSLKRASFWTTPLTKHKAYI